MKLLRPKEVAERLAVSDRTIYRLVDEGKIASYRIGGAVRISEEDLEAYLESRKLKAFKRKGQ